MIKTFRKRLADAIDARGIGMKPLSKMAGLGERAVNDMLNGGDKGPALSGVIAVAKALDVSVAYLIGEEGDPLQSEQRRSRPLPPLTALKIDEVNPTSGGRVLVEIETEAGTLELLLSREQALYLSRHLDRAEEKVSTVQASS